MQIAIVLIAVFSFALAPTLPTAPTATGATAPPRGGCPRVLLMLDSAERGAYVVVFGANKPLTTAVGMTLYTKAGSFVASANAVAIDRDSGVRNVALRSLPLVIARPRDGSYLAARFRFTPEDGEKCRAVDEILAPAPPDLAPAARTMVADAKTVTAIMPNSAPDSAPLTCDQPFETAATVHVVSPPYPQVARDAGAIGLVEVKVTLDAAGAVTAANIYKSSDNEALDAAAVGAARATTYRPGVFLCKPQGGAYIFQADFTGRSPSRIFR